MGLIKDTVDLYEAYSADFHFGPLEVTMPDDRAKNKAGSCQDGLIFSCFVPFACWRTHGLC